MKMNVSTIHVLSLITICCILFSCAPDNSEVKPAEEKTTEFSAKADKKPKVKPTPPALNKNAMINYRDVNINFLADLLHDEVNKVRKVNGLKAFRKNTVLKNAATDQNNYLVRLGDLSHTQNVAGKNHLVDRVKHYGGGFRGMAENVLYEGFVIRTSNGKKEIITQPYAEMAKKMVVSWMNSPGHRKNIMNPNYNYLGTGIGYNADLHAVFATQVYGYK